MPFTGTKGRVRLDMDNANGTLHEPAACYGKGFAEEPRVSQRPGHLASSLR